MAVQMQNFYESTLSGPISATDLVIPINTPPSVTEGWLLLDYDVPAKREFIYFTARSGTNVTLPSLAIGRGRDSTTAIAHTQNAKIRMNVSAGLLNDVAGNSAAIVNANNNGGWVAMPGNAVPTSVTNLGQRSYSMQFNGVDLTPTLSAGQRLKTTRTVPAPIQSTSLNGTNQYWVKTAPNKMTFTDDFVVDAYVKLTSYPSGVGTIASRYNGTSGWLLFVNPSGTVTLSGRNGSSANLSEVTTYQSLPLNKWVRVTAQLDMSAFTATSTTSYIMLDGTDVPCSLARTGTNPTALVQAGNYEVGSFNGGTNPLAGKIAQVAIFNAKVPQATMLGYHSQGYTGAETSLVSAYAFNGTAVDLMTTTPNDLTAMNSAGYTADAPFGNSGKSSTLDYAMVMADPVFAAGNTTAIVSVPEGCTIPTSGGVSAVVYSSVGVPFGFPKDIGKFRISAFFRGTGAWSGPTQNVHYNPAGFQLAVPVGKYMYGWKATVQSTQDSGPSTGNNSFLLEKSVGTEDNTELTIGSVHASNVANATQLTPAYTRSEISNSAIQVVYLVLMTTSATSASRYLAFTGGSFGGTVIYAENSLL